MENIKYKKSSKQTKWKTNRINKSKTRSKYKHGNRMVKNMSANNYVIVRKFGDNSFGWAIFFASDRNPNTSDGVFRKNGKFNTPQKTANAVFEFCEGIIGYGINFEKVCSEDKYDKRKSNYKVPSSTDCLIHRSILKETFEYLDQLMELIDITNVIQETSDKGAKE